MQRIFTVLLVEDRKGWKRAGNDKKVRRKKPNRSKCKQSTQEQLKQASKDSKRARETEQSTVIELGWNAGKTQTLAAGNSLLACMQHGGVPFIY